MNEEQSPPQSVNNITLPLTRFLNYIVSDEKLGIMSREVHEQDALIIKAKDVNEIYCHVEFPSQDNDLFAPRIWPIKEWQESERKRIKMHEQVKLERHRYDTFNANIEKIARHLVEMTGDSKEFCLKLAEKMARKTDAQTLEQLEMNELKEFEEIQQWSQRFTKL